MPEKPIEIDRRGFLLLAGSGSTAGASLLLSHRPEERASGAQPRGSDGFSETEHVRRFYRLARF